MHSKVDSSSSIQNQIIQIDKEEKILKISDVEILSFGQSEPITSRLASILKDYPKGTQIFRELLQNADDAKATHFSLCLDEKDFSPKTKQEEQQLFHPKMANQMLKSLALLAYNNASFEEKDFESIRKLGQSRKKSDFGKTGRFGIGFNSVYHLTDYPSFISDKYYVLFDPHRRLIPRDLLIHGDPGFRINFVEQSQSIPTFAAQFKPFEFSMYQSELSQGITDAYPGTLFRFPLRTKEQASESKISRSYYDQEEVMDMLRTFMREAHEDILFLKHVSKITLYHRSANEEAAKLLFCVTLEGLEKSDQVNRVRINEILKDPQSFLTNLQQDYLYHYKLSLKHWIADEYKDQLQDIPIEQNWILGCCVGTGKARELALESFVAQTDGRMIPFGSVAMPLTPNEHISGKSYCFLPVGKTGLPVHVNSFFELTSNRRDIWKGTEGDKGEVALKTQWNIALQQYVLAPAYASLLSQLAKEMQLDSFFYSFFPQQQKAGLEWNPLIKALYFKLMNSQYKIFQDVSHRMVTADTALLFNRGSHSVKELELFKKVLLATTDCQIVENIPAFVEAEFALSESPLHHLSPSLMRDSLRYKENFGDLFKSEEDIINLLSYVISDDDWQTDLNGLCLIPVLDGTFQMFGEKARAQDVYLASDSEIKLLSQFESTAKKICKALPETRLRGLLELIMSKSKVNLEHLSFAVAKKLIDSVFPAEVRDKREVNWTDKSILSEYFISTLFSYISTSYEKDKSCLEVFKYIPFIPCNNNTILIALSEQRAFVNNGFVSNTTVVSVLEQLGLRFANEEICNLNSKHSIVPFLNGNNLIQALVAIGQEAIVLRLASIDSSSKRVFKKWILDYVLDTAKDISFIASLPMFETMAGNFVELDGSLSSIKLHLPENEAVKKFIIECSFMLSEQTQHIINFTDQKEYEQLRQILNQTKASIQEWKKSEFILQVLMPKIEMIVKDWQSREEEYVSKMHKIMLSVLDELHILEKEQNGFMEALSAKIFVPVGLVDSNQIQSYTAPKSCFDPRNHDLRQLFANRGNVFPVGVFGTERVLANLELLSMKKNLNAKTLLALVQQISQMDNSTLGKYELSVLVLQHLDKHAESSMNNSTWQDVFSKIKNIKWIPVGESKTISLLSSLLQKYHHGTTSLATAVRQYGKFEASSNMQPLESLDICSSFIPACAIEVHSNYLKKVFGWYEKVPIKFVLKHLQWISQTFSVIMKTKPEDSVVQQLQDMISADVEKIYSYLDAELSVMDQASAERVMSAFKSFSGIWTGDQFVSTNQVALNSRVNLKPLLYEFPTQMQRYRVLMSALQIKSNFELENYISCLETLPNSKALSQQDLIQVAVLILQTIYNDPKLHGSEFVTIKEKLMAPSAKGHFMPIKNLVYVDTKQFEEVVNQASEQDEFINTLQNKLIHKEIANEVAKNLGAQSLTALMEDQASQLLNQKGKSKFEGEEFGQSEPLTIRIANILKDYPFTDATIFKEMLQNAEDAKATSFGIVLDLRTLPSDSLLNPSLNIFQGPSILVYNNSIFTDADIKGIQQLGVANKLSDKSKIGRFGIGFNSVYHYTDLPSFVSGDKFIMMDPHTRYIRGATIGHPGRLYHFTNPTFKLFKDQLAPFDHSCFQFDSSKQFDGTIFRLPLRTVEQAKSSLISKTYWTKESMLDQLNLFIRDAKNCLLFLRNVKEIFVRVKTEDNNDDLLLQVDVSRDSSITEMENYVKSFADKMTGKGGKPNQINLVDDFDDFLKPSSSKKKAKKASKKSTDFFEEYLTNYRKESIGNLKMNIIQKDTNESLKHSSEKWIISSVLADDLDIFRCMKSNSSSSLRLVPYGAIACPLDEDQLPQQDLEGYWFSFLPLPTKSGLPFHTHAFFELGSNRRDIWRSSDAPVTVPKKRTSTKSNDYKGRKNRRSLFDESDEEVEEEFEDVNLEKENDPRALWNQLLMKRCIAPALIQLVSHLAEINFEKASVDADSFSKLYVLLPTQDKIGSDVMLTTFANEFYTKLQTAEIFLAKAVPDRLYPISRLYIQNANNNDSTDTRKNSHQYYHTDGGNQNSIAALSKEMVPNLMADKFPLLILDSKLIDTMKLYMNDIRLQFCNPRSVIQFYREFFTKREHVSSFCQRITEQDEKLYTSESQKLMILWRYCLKEGAALREKVSADEFYSFPVPLSNGSWVYPSNVVPLFSRITGSKSKKSVSRSQESSKKNSTALFYSENEDLVKKFTLQQTSSFLDSQFLGLFAVAFSKDAVEHVFSVRKFDLSALKNILVQQFPKLTTLQTMHSSIPAEQAGISKQYLHHVWSFIEKESDDVEQIKDIFRDLALIPSQFTSSLQTSTDDSLQLVFVENGKQVVNASVSSSGNHATKEVFGILLKLGILTILPEFAVYTSLRKVTSELADGELIDFLWQVHNNSRKKTNKNSSLFHFGIFSTMKRLVGSSSSDSSSSDSSQTASVENLSGPEKRTLLEYINPNKLNEHDDIRKLCQLPLFEKVAGTSTSFTSIDPKQCYCINSTRVLQLPQLPSHLDLLVEIPSLTNLYRTIGVSFKTLDQFYREIIATQENWNTLSAEARLQHMQFIKNNHGLSFSMKHLIKDLPFINTNAGFKSISMLCDPHHPVLQEFMPKDRFPPSFMQENGSWMHFLQENGLIKEVSKELFLQFTDLLEMQGTLSQRKASRSRRFFDEEAEEPLATPDELISKAKLLFSELPKFVNDLELLRTVSKKAIFPIEPQTMQPNQTEILYPLEHLISQKYYDIAHSVAPILHKDFEAFGQLIATKVTTLSLKPKFAQVLSHLKNKALELQDKTLNKEQVEEVHKLYNYLHQHFQPVVSKQIASTPLILGSDRKFKAPRQVFWKLENDIPPLFYKMPDELLQWKKLFDGLGVEETPSSAVCNSILEEMQTKQQQSKKPLNPFDLNLAIQCIKLSTGKKSEVQQQQQNQSIYIVPNTNGILCHVDEVVVNDAPYLKDVIDESRFQFLHFELISIASSLSVTKLSDRIEEILIIPSQINTSQSDIANRLRNKLLNPDLFDILLKIVLHEARMKLDEKSTKLEMEQQVLSLVERARKLKETKIIALPQIQSKWMDTKTNQDVTKANSTAISSSICGFDAKKLIFYLKESIPPFYDVELLLTQKWVQYLTSGNVTSNIILPNSATILGMVLKCENKDQMDQVCKTFQITSLSPVDQSSINAANELVNPTLGNEVSIDNYEFVPLIPGAESVQIGEVIAYKLAKETHILRFGRVVKQLSANQVRIELHHNVFQTVHLAEDIPTIQLFRFRHMVSEKEMQQVAWEQNKKLQQQSSMSSKEAQQLVSDLETCMLCPITQDLMAEPVMLTDGRTYEKSAIMHHLQQSKNSPVTRDPINPKFIVPNYMIKAVTEQLITYQKKSNKK